MLKILNFPRIGRTSVFLTYRTMLSVSKNVCINCHVAQHNEPYRSEEQVKLDKVS